MAANRGWMYERINGGCLNPQFMNGVLEFVEFAKQQHVYVETATIRCPCKTCKNRRWLDVDTITYHLYSKGFVPNYYCWRRHGEIFRSAEIAPPAPPVVANPYQNMVLDGMGPAHDWGTENNAFEEVPNPDAMKFLELMRAAEDPLYEGCRVSLLEMAARIMKHKCDNNLTHCCVDDLASMISDILPEKNLMRRSFYEIKNVIKALELPHEKIHACPKGCMLFWKGDVHLERCLKCNCNRYKVSHRGRRIPRKVLNYFPIAPRLQRLYGTKSTADQMRWHADNPRTPGTLAHPSDGEAWKHVDKLFPEFASECRNPRLGLCTDGFMPFGKFGGNYSCWPVILTPYNLPPELCNKKPFMFLTLLIPGRKNPKGNLDVYLQPLIEELRTLWEVGCVTYDVSTKQNFTLKAIVLWTISDFPAYGMLSGYSTAGKHACPICMDRTKSFYLRNGRKISWFDCHRQFLPPNHPFRRNKRAFLRNRSEAGQPPPRSDGNALWEVVSRLPKVTHANYCPARVKKDSVGWNKQSIMWDLPYWRHLLIRHNLDVMHIEKNFFEQLIHTLLDDGHSADDIKSRKDMALHCCRKDLEPIVDGVGRDVMPTAPFVINNAQRKVLCEWLSELKFPDGYASNLGRCVDLNTSKLSGLKSHDCHVFMERLIPVAFKELLPTNVWQVVTEISQFFRDLCAATITEAEITRLDDNIPVILCKMEKIFPPSFFNVMEHLPVHLPYEAKVGGPVQYRWMYPFERYLDFLKKKVGNKARVEGSICNAYLMEEISTFCGRYFEDHVHQKLKDPPRNVTSVDEIKPQIPHVFHSFGRTSTRGRQRYLDDKEYDRAHLYVLSNCGILGEYERRFEQHILNQHCGLNIAQVWSTKEEEFPLWFKNEVLNSPVTDDVIIALAFGPRRRVKTFSQYFINGFNFHTYAYGQHKSTMSYGVRVSGEEGHQYYGILDEVLELTYTGEHAVYRTMLFNCSWMDTVTGMNVHPNYKLVSLDRDKKYPKYDPFVVAYQGFQFYFTTYPSLSSRRQRWVAVFDSKARSTVHAPVDTICFQAGVQLNPPGLTPEQLDLEDLQEQPHASCSAQDPGGDFFEQSLPHAELDPLCPDDDTDEDLADEFLETDSDDSEEDEYNDGHNDI